MSAKKRPADIEQLTYRASGTHPLDLEIFSSIALIAERLGFQYPTNFVKFFKREVGCTPGEFRRRQSEVRAPMARKARA